MLEHFLRYSQRMLRDAPKPIVMPSAYRPVGFVVQPLFLSINCSDQQVDVRLSAPACVLIREAMIQFVSDSSNRTESVYEFARKRFRVRNECHNIVPFQKAPDISATHAPSHWPTVIACHVECGVISVVVRPQLILDRSLDCLELTTAAVQILTRL